MMRCELLQYSVEVKLRGERERDREIELKVMTVDIITNGLPNILQRYKEGAIDE